MGYVEKACIVALLSAYIHLADAQQSAAYQISVMVPNFTENVAATVVCKVNNTELNAVNCPFSLLPITRLRIILSNDPPSTPVLTGTEMCDFSSFLACTHGPPVSALECGCYHDGGDIYTVNVTITADSAVHENKTIDCRPDCVKARYQYGLVNTVTGVPIVFETISTTTITTTTSSTTLPTSTSNSLNITSSVLSSSVTNIANTSVTSAPSTSPPPPPFPGWCIAVIVIGIILVIVIIAIVVFIIKKCKKEEQQGNRFHCHPYDKRKKGACPCGFYPDDEPSSNNVHTPNPAPGGNNRTELTTPNPPPEGNNRTELTKVNHPAQGGNKWTELTPKNAQGGNNRTELTIQDAKEMQDNKHLGTNNSPEKDKRRKKKKKKNTFQEVDGEPVSREDKSTVDDYKAAQNDNSVSVDESSPAIDNGGHRSLPMPKLSHLTSVERNSTIFQSETPRKLPPLQLKQ